MFKGPFDYSIIKRSIDKKIISIEFVNIRDFGLGKHKAVDDKPFGGGKGMILRVDVLDKAIEKTRKGLRNTKVILLDPKGEKFDQKKAESFSKLNHLILICGHYEGVDKRLEKFIDEKISVGDFIVSGGEIPTMLITDAVARLVKGALKEGVANSESFSPYLPRGKAGLEYPQYTKPRNYKNLRVPKILLSGNHKKIKEWQNAQSIKKTIKLRPDLLEKRVRGGSRNG